MSQFTSDHQKFWAIHRKCQADRLDIPKTVKQLLTYPQVVQQMIVTHLIFLYGHYAAEAQPGRYFFSSPPSSMTEAESKKCMFNLRQVVHALAHNDPHPEKHYKVKLNPWQQHLLQHYERLAPFPNYMSTEAQVFAWMWGSSWHKDLEIQENYNFINLPRLTTYAREFGLSFDEVWFFLRSFQTDRKPLTPIAVNLACRALANISERILRKVGSDHEQPPIVVVDVYSLSGERPGDPEFPDFLETAPPIVRRGEARATVAAADRFPPSDHQRSNINFPAKIRSLEPFDNSAYDPTPRRRRNTKAEGPDSPTPPPPPPQQPATVPGSSAVLQSRQLAELQQRNAALLAQITQQREEQRQKDMQAMGRRLDWAALQRRKEEELRVREEALELREREVALEKDRFAAEQKERENDRLASNDAMSITEDVYDDYDDPDFDDEQPEPDASKENESRLSTLTPDIPYASSTPEHEPEEMGQMADMDIGGDVNMDSAIDDAPPQFAGSEPADGAAPVFEDLPPADHGTESREQSTSVPENAMDDGQDGSAPAAEAKLDRNEFSAPAADDNSKTTDTPAPTTENDADGIAPPQEDDQPGDKTPPQAGNGEIEVQVEEKEKTPPPPTTPALTGQKRSAGEAGLGDEQENSEKRSKAEDSSPNAELDSAIEILTAATRPVIVPSPQINTLSLPSNDTLSTQNSLSNQEVASLRALLDPASQRRSPVSKRPEGDDKEEAAFGRVKVSLENMAEAVREMERGSEVSMRNGRKADGRFTCSAPEEKMLAGAPGQQESVDEFTAAQEATLRAKLEGTSEEAKRLAEGESLVFKATRKVNGRFLYAIVVE